MKRIVVLLTLLAAVACSEPLEFADWTIPVPVGTPVLEYPGVVIGKGLQSVLATKVDSLEEWVESETKIVANIAAEPAVRDLSRQVVAAYE